MPDTPKSDENRPQPIASEVQWSLGSAGPLLGGVVFGIGLAILPVALDRAELPTPIPNSLSWHHPDRTAEIRIGEYAQRQYIDLEVSLVDDLLHGRFDEEARADALSYLRQRGSVEGIRQWAGAQEPWREEANALAAAFVVAPISWEMEPGESIDTSYDELASVADAEAVSEVPSLWLGVPEPNLPALEPPAIEPEPSPAVESVVAVDEPTEDVQAPTPVLVSAVLHTAPMPAAPTPSVASIDMGLREPAVAQNRVYVELSEGDPETVGPAVTGRLSQLVQCYENALEFDADSGGNVEFEWNIHLGRVNSLAVGDDTLGDEIAVRCMSERIRRWRFAPDVSGLVSWRFAFESNPG